MSIFSENNHACRCASLLNAAASKCSKVAHGVYRADTADLLYLEYEKMTKAQIYEDTRNTRSSLTEILRGREGCSDRHASSHHHDIGVRAHRKTTALCSANHHTGRAVGGNWIVIGGGDMLGTSATMRAGNTGKSNDKN